MSISDHSLQRVDAAYLSSYKHCMGCEANSAQRTERRTASFFEVQLSDMSHRYMFIRGTF